MLVGGMSPILFTKVPDLDLHIYDQANNRSHAGSVYTTIRTTRHVSDLTRNTAEIACDRHFPPSNIRILDCLQNIRDSDKIPMKKMLIPIKIW